MADIADRSAVALGADFGVSVRLPAAFCGNWAIDVFDRWARDPEKLAMLGVSPDGQPRRQRERDLARAGHEP